MALTDARVHAAIDAAVATVTHVQLHTDYPGPSGTSDVSIGVDRAAITLPPAAGKATSGNVEFAIPDASGPHTHVSLWTAAEGGTFSGSGIIEPAESFAGPGTLAVTVTVSGSSGGA